MQSSFEGLNVKQILGATSITVALFLKSQAYLAERNYSTNRGIWKVNKNVGFW